MRKEEDRKMQAEKKNKNGIKESNQNVEY